jgi:hypothetical protein
MRRALLRCRLQWANGSNQAGLRSRVCSLGQGKRQVARSRPGDDRGQEPGQDRAIVRRSSNDSVPLAPSVSARAIRRQASTLKRNRRGGRDLHPRILQRPMVRSAVTGAKAERNGPTPGLHQDNIPSSSPATGRARGWTPFCRTPTAPRSPPC